MLNKNSLKFLCIKALLFLVIISPLFSEAATETKVFEDYRITATYLPENFPGDAVFVRISFSTTSKKFIKKIPDGFQATGTLKLFRITEGKEDTEIKKSNFYTIKNLGNKKKHITEILSGLPLSSYQKTGNYYILAELSYLSGIQHTFRLPVKILEKEFISETIHLNAQNTAIKTNTSSKRTNQINSLNKILQTVNSDSTFELNAFEKPTPITRRTSFFADRRIYAYSNGKSSTSLHYGIDFGVPEGNEVRSAGGGKVVMAEDRVSTGWSVCIEHLPGLYSLYYHNSELKVKEGDIVKKGDLIAISGATGLATGPHVHWEMRLNMEAVSPDFFLDDFTFETKSEKL